MGPVIEAAVVGIGTYRITADGFVFASMEDCEGFFAVFCYPSKDSDFDGSSEGQQRRTAGR